MSNNNISSSSNSRKRGYDGSGDAFNSEEDDFGLCSTLLGMDSPMEFDVIANMENPQGDSTHSAITIDNDDVLQEQNAAGDKTPISLAFSNLSENYIAPPSGSSSIVWQVMKNLNPKGMYGSNKNIIGKYI